MGKMHKKKDKSKKDNQRPKLNLDVELKPDDIRAITMIALQETLIIEHQSFTDPKSDQGKILKGMKNLLDQLNNTYIGAVPVELVEFSDRYLCKVQDAMDTFFDEITEHDRAKMERVKSNWKTGVSA